MPVLRTLHLAIVMAALWNRAGHYISILWFLSIFFFSSPDLSGCTLEVYYTLTHGVALVRIYYAGLKCAVRGSLKMQDAKNWPSGHHCTTLSGYIFATKARIDNWKKTVKQQYLLHMSAQYGELRPTSGWDQSSSLRHPCKFQMVSHLGSVTARHFSSWHQPNFRHWTEGATYIPQAAITLGIDPRSSYGNPME